MTIDRRRLLPLGPMGIGALASPGPRHPPRRQFHEAGIPDDVLEAPPRQRTQAFVARCNASVF